MTRCLSRSLWRTGTKSSRAFTSHFGAVRGPQEVIEDPQLRLNDMVVPLEGAGGKLGTTISSPIQVHGVTKVPARRAPAFGEHNHEVLKQLGFSAREIAAFHASGAVTTGGTPVRPVAGQANGESQQ